MIHRRPPLLCCILIAQCVTAGCGRGNNNKTSPQQSSSTSTSGTVSEQQASQGRYQQGKAAAMEYAQKVYEQGGLKSPVLPNYPAGPGRPSPVQVNFYQIHDDHPDYLLCLFDVDESPYDPSEESRWFESALRQIRNTGQTRFPPVKWVAVIIRNRAEQKDAQTYERAHRVGAVFALKDVFNSSCSLSKLVAAAQLDRHPFAYDPQRTISWEQDRWLIVERNAATTRRER